MRLLTNDDQQVRTALSKFLDGCDLPEGMISDPIYRSWERLRRSGFRPEDRAAFDFSQVTQKALPERNDALLRAASPQMAELRRSTTSNAWSVLCIDMCGTIIGSLYDTRHGHREVRAAPQLGHSLHEDDVGTNAAACALVEGKPVIVQRSEHFLFNFDSYVCAAAPIFDPAGELAGVLAAGGVGVTLQQQDLDHVALSARAIEARLFEDISEASLLELHFMKEFVGTPVGGVLAISEESGRIIAANRAACEMLSSGPINLYGVELSEVFDDTIGGRIEEGEITRSVLCHSGRRIFVRQRHANARATRFGKSQSAISQQTSQSEDPKVTRAIESGRKAARRRLPMLLMGETGSGKEVLARTIHHDSGLQGPFIAVNCCAIPESLIEAELFGYADGAFTGARKGGGAGAIEQANKGTLFLDEIGDASLALQAKLLRVLQEGSFNRLGSRQEVHVEILLIAATHRNLKELIAEGTFREDLYYRLNGLTISLPPLRDRTDISTLVDKILTSFALDGEQPRLNESARELLLTHPWPGNVRQLRQVLAAATTMADDPVEIGIEDLPPDFLEYFDQSVIERREARSSSLIEHQSALISRTLADVDNNVSEAARRLKVSRTTIYKHMRKSVRQLNGWH